MYVIKYIIVSSLRGISLSSTFFDFKISYKNRVLYSVCTNTVVLTFLLCKRKYRGMEPRIYDPRRLLRVLVDDEHNYLVPTMHSKF